MRMGFDEVMEPRDFEVAKTQLRGLLRHVRGANLSLGHISSQVFHFRT